MEEEALAKEFGALIRRLRLEKAYSQEGLAEAAKLERAYLGKIERGEVNVSVRTAYKLARALGTTLSSMFSELERNRDATSTTGD
jgi:transcriptional regulator with XRE-family HTH domain